MVVQYTVIISSNSRERPVSDIVTTVGLRSTIYFLVFVLVLLVVLVQVIQQQDQKCTSSDAVIILGGLSKDISIQ
jgi:hypothetical protein